MCNGGNEVKDRMKKIKAMKIEKEIMGSKMKRMK